MSLALQVVSQLIFNYFGLGLVLLVIALYGAGSGWPDPVVVLLLLGTLVAWGVSIWGAFRREF